MTCYHPLNTSLAPPPRFTYPFCYEPHPLALQAVAEVERYLMHWDHEPGRDQREGKMLGVLVVERTGGELGFLAAYSGLLDGRNDWPWFVPPVFDSQQPDGHFKQREREISELTVRIASLPSDSPEAVELKERRRLMSEELQMWLFRQYRLLNARSEERDVVEVWQDYHCSPSLRRKFPLPPGGTGDCCAPKLLQYAYRMGLRPVVMAEFWWGPSPKSEIRHHRQFYPACRGKCKPVLTWMLQGLDVDPNPETLGFEKLEIGVVYEDDALMVVEKPAGMLSVPGREESYSVATLVAAMRPGASVAHRLDMWTSGLMVVAKTAEAFSNLQQQFVHRSVRKRYMAVVEGTPDRPNYGEIRLPLFSDPLNRPRQTVDYRRGKTAVTAYELLGPHAKGTLVALYPHTGRTHQLRMHCAHPNGLGCPIVGDELYGHQPLLPPEHGQRLLLHAEQLWLLHPTDGRPLHFCSPCPF